MASAISSAWRAALRACSVSPLTPVMCWATSRTPWEASVTLADVSLVAACCWLTVWAMDFATAPISPTVSLMPWMQPTASSVALGLKGLTRADLVTPFGDGAAHGNFLAFRTPDAGPIEAALAAADVHADHRGDRMRFGFGLATTLEDVDVAIERMIDLLAK